jgi:hypothetical protein
LHRFDLRVLIDDVAEVEWLVVSEFQARIDEYKRVRNIGRARFDEKGVVAVPAKEVLRALDLTEDELFVLFGIKHEDQVALVALDLKILTRANRGI